MLLLGGILFWGAVVLALWCFYDSARSNSGWALFAGVACLACALFCILSPGVFAKSVDFGQMMTRTYQSYATVRDDSYDGLNNSPTYDIGGHHYTDGGSVSVSHYHVIGAKPNYRVKVVTHELSSAQKAAWSSSLNPVKKSLAARNQKFVDVEFYK